MCTIVFLSKTCLSFIFLKYAFVLKLAYEIPPLDVDNTEEKNVLDIFPSEILSLFYLNKMFFILLYSIVLVIKNLYYSFNIAVGFFFFLKLCLQ